MLELGAIVGDFVPFILELSSRTNLFKQCRYMILPTPLFKSSFEQLYLDLIIEGLFARSLIVVSFIRMLF